MGYGGGELALASVLDLDLAWYAEVDPDCSGLLAHRWPDVPNLGDLTAIAWDEVEPVDVLTAGYPCQPFSQAGARQGEDDERHLWPAIAHGLSILRPPFVFLENVRGHLTLGFDRVLADLDELGYSVEWSLLAAADVGACHGRTRLWVAATLEAAPSVDGTPCGYRDGDGWTTPQVGLWDEPIRLRPPVAGSVRAGVMFGAERLAPAAPTEGLMPTPMADESDPTEEYAAELREVGVDPHARLYLPGRAGHSQRTLRRIVASDLLPTPSVADSLGGHHTAPALEQALELAAGDLPREFESWDEVPGRSRVLPTPTTSDARGPSPNHEGTTAEAIDALVPTPTGMDAHGSRRRTARKEHWTSADGVTLTDFTLLLPEQAARNLPTPRASDANSPGVHGNGGPLPTPTARLGSERGAQAKRYTDPERSNDLDDALAWLREDPERWGPYAAAIARHARLVGRPAPDPTNDNRQLSPVFVEWMMTLPAGWVTDLIDRRTTALRILGNGIVPACGAVAWSWLARRLGTL